MNKFIKIVAALALVSGFANAQEKQMTCKDAIDVGDILVGYGGETVEVAKTTGEALETAGKATGRAIGAAAKATAQYVLIEYKDAKSRRNYDDPVVAVVAIAGDGTAHLVAKVSKDIAKGVAKGVSASVGAVRTAALATANYVSKPYVDAWNEFSDNELIGIFQTIGKGTAVLVYKTAKGAVKGVVIAGKAVGKALVFPVKLVVKFIKNANDKSCESAMKKLKKQLEKGQPLSLG